MSNPSTVRSRYDHGRDGYGREAENAGADHRQAVSGRSADGTGKQAAEAVRAIGVTEPTHYRWRSEHGGLQLDHMKRVKQLEAENK